MGPKSGSGRTWAPCPSGAMVTHYEGEFIKSKLHHMFLLAIWLGWTPYTLTPRAQGAQKGGLVRFWSLRGAFWRKLYQTKVARHPQLSGGRSPYRTWRGLQGPGRPMSGYSHILLVSNQILSLNTIFNTYFESSRATPGNPS